MRPRTEEERRRQRNCGFVAFMNRLMDRLPRTKCKMEKEMKKRVHERDLAQSKMEDLLRVVEESCQMSTSRSSVAYHVPDFGFAEFATYERDNKNDNPEPQNALSPSQSISSPIFSAAVRHQREEKTAHGSFEDSSNLCKDVRCIEKDGPVGNDPSSLLEEGNEMDGPVGSGDSNSFVEECSESILQQTSESTRNGEHELSKQMGWGPPRPNFTDITKVLMKHLKGQLVIYLDPEE